MKGLLTYIGWRIVRGVLTLIALSAMTYFMVEVSIEGGVRAVILGSCPDDAQGGFCGALIEKYRLNDPPVVRYLKWLIDVFQWDFNTTLGRNGQPVIDRITHRAPITTQLAISGVLLAVVVSLPLGVYSAYRHTSRSGRAISTTVQTMQSIPVFVSGLVLIWIFSEQLDLLPATGWTRLTKSLSGNLKNLILPAVTVALAEIGVFARVIRADLIQTFDAEYVHAAKAKGLSPLYLMFRHVMRPASLGLVTVIGLNLSALLGGVVIVEIVFALGGIGPELVDAIEQRDIYLVQGIVLYIGAIYVVISAVVDYVYSLLDPRVVDVRKARSQYV